MWTRLDCSSLDLCRGGGGIVSERETMLTTFPSVRSSRVADCPSERALGAPTRQPGGHMMALLVIPTRFSHFLISLSHDLLLAQSFAGSWLLVLRKCEMCANYDIMICLPQDNRHSFPWMISLKSIPQQSFPPPLPPQSNGRLLGSILLLGGQSVYKRGRWWTTLSLRIISCQRH